MSPSNFNWKVDFLNIKEKYSSASSMDVEICFNDGFKASADDWIGLFKVGWLSEEEAITSVSFSGPESPYGEKKEFTINGLLLNIYF